MDIRGVKQAMRARSTCFVSVSISSMNRMYSITRGSARVNGKKIWEALSASASLIVAKKSLVVKLLTKIECYLPLWRLKCTSYLNVFVQLFEESLSSIFELPNGQCTPGKGVVGPNARRKTKIVCTIGPSTSSREMIWKLAEEGMNVARLNMSHGDHASHQKTIDLVKEYNSQFEDKAVAIMLDTKGPEVRSGDVPQPIILKEGQEFNFTIKRGVSTEDTVSVNYDDFVNDVEVGDILLVDGGMMSLAVKSKTKDLVKCIVVDGGELKSRRHLNVRGKSANLPSITDKDWEDIKFGVDNQVDFYAVSFVKDAKVVHELKDYLKSCNADIHVIVKIESADSIPNLHSIISASDGAMVARGDLGAELPIEDVPLLQEDIIRRCRSMQKPVIVATNMLESMIDHPTPTRAEVSDIAIAVREGADAVMLSGETAHGKFPLKAVKVMHTVALRTESSLPVSITPPTQFSAHKSHMGDMFAFHSTTMANTLNTPIIVFTRTGSMAVILSHYRPSSTIFAFTNQIRIWLQRENSSLLSRVERSQSGVKNLLTTFKFVRSKADILLVKTHF
ncbi:Plastidial pyruvate kinase 3 [Citrus sinensis]|uniref:Plastidial pyruvate kinase 3 n=1 Tax=Citrus sinensis TaxID=2711 RepID=A0ACB8L8U0_CITSI|nr:Plastidial pyruvate kinase 3 [Citrus sinensis]